MALSWDGNQAIIQVPWARTFKFFCKELGPRVRTFGGPGYLRDQPAPF